MAGTVDGGKLAAQTNKVKDPDFYKKIGRLGGSTKTDKPKGFAAQTFEQRSAAGRKGGMNGKPFSRKS